MRCAWKTDVGLVRENNEDFVVADEQNGIFLLADGMGGAPAGEVASELAVTTVHELLRRELAAPQAEVSGRLLADALAAAHSAVAKRGLSDRLLKGMGTTLEILVIRNHHAMICHVGDSRIYLYRHGRLRQVTIDDNYAAAFARLERLPFEDIPATYRHVLTQAVGISEELIPQILTFEVYPGDLLLICSDGLNGVVSDQRISEVIKEKGSDLEGAAQVLMEAADREGGPDNVSVILVEPVQPEGPPLLLT